VDRLLQHDIDSIDTTFWVSEYEGSGLVDQARARFVASGGAGDFDFDQARREAADRLVVGKVLDTLDYVRRHPRVNGWVMS
jgi:hypothetical protein